MNEGVVSKRPVSIPNGLYFLWATIYQIKDKYNIATLSGRVELVAWWLINGVKEYPALDITIEEDERLYEPANIPEQDDSYPVSRIAFATAELNDALMDSLNISRLEDRIKIINWYYNHAVKGVRKLSESDLKYFFDEAIDIKQDTLMPITRAMMLNWHVREDIHSLFDLSTKAGRLGFEGWWLSYGYIEAPPYALPEYQYRFLSEIATEIEQDTYLPIIRAMLFYGGGDREELQKTFDLTTRAGRMSLEAWWLTTGYKDLPPYELTLEQYSTALKEAPGITQDSDVPITREMVIIWNSYKKLRKSYDLATQKGRQGYVQWWNRNAGEKAYIKPASIKHDGATILSEDPSLKNNGMHIYGSYFSGGLNLIGLVKGELGIGEDVRMAARAMSVAEINFSIFDFPKQSYSRQQDLSLSDHIKNELVYNVNMVNLTGFEHASLFAKYGKKIFDKRFTIGAWPWELPKWPRLCDCVFNLVDEIWASSRYAVDAFSNSPVPVVHMPMAVDFDSVPDYTRSDFGLPSDSYLFLYVFDSLSYMARKNPIGHLEAFWRAFPRTLKDVGLVVKTMNVDMDNETWNKFHEMVSTDDRIILISETFSKNKILGLMNCCDAFLSLHRSEGFGRCIAEMMWLGKPVIATNFSGNTDFTTKETAFLVDGPLVVVRQGEYPYSENQYWCNPDVEQAAHYMRICFEGGETVNKIAAAGNKLIKQNYSFEEVAKKYTERLKHLGIL